MEVIPSSCDGAGWFRHHADTVGTKVQSRFDTYRHNKNADVPSQAYILDIRSGCGRHEFESHHLYNKYGLVSQLVENLTVNQGVMGSSPIQSARVSGID